MMERASLNRGWPKRTVSFILLLRSICNEVAFERRQQAGERPIIRVEDVSVDDKVGRNATASPNIFIYVKDSAKRLLCFADLS